MTNEQTTPKVMIDSEPVVALMDHIYDMIPDSDEKAVQLWNAVSYEIFKTRGNK